MRHTTHKLSEEQKAALFKKHKDLISLIHNCGDMMLRKQIKVLYHMLHPDIDMATTEFDIAELILSGFLLQLQIQKPSRTQMLYLSKYPRSYFYDNKDKTGDVPAITFTNTKVYTQIFKTEYLIERIIPAMQKKDLLISDENILSYLYWTSSNLLLNGSQYNNSNFYERFKNVCEQKNIPLDYDFLRDSQIAAYEKDCFIRTQLKQNTNLAECTAKIQRDTERASYTSEVEQSKYFYNFNNFHKQGFVIEDIDTTHIQLAYFDINNNLNIKTLYKNLCFIYLMFGRYTKIRDLKLDATIYVWDKEKAEHLAKEETIEAFDFYTQELSGLSKKFKTMKDIGLLPQHWENINASYKSMDIFEKYNLRPQS